MISLQASIQLPPLEPKMQISQRVMLNGSCFSEHIGQHLVQCGMEVNQNPCGILFDPLSVCHSLLSCIHNTLPAGEELFLHQELWRHWQFHSRFSHPDKEMALHQMQTQIAEGHTFLKKTQWLMITLGSSFSYQLVERKMPVANCHKMPASMFHKHLCTIEETITALDGVLYQLFRFNPEMKIVFTISPVRHLRDGVVANNRSKARLLEAVHHLTGKFSRLYYFPSYELVIDVLRDYRFFDTDLAHPNYAATRFVIAHFMEYAFGPEDRELARRVNQLYTASRHRSDHPGTKIHQQFLTQQLAQVLELKKEFAYLQLQPLESVFKHQLTQEL